MCKCDHYSSAYAQFPKKCKCSSDCAETRSEEVYYSGPNLPNTGINTEDTITLALQKIDNKLSPENLIAYIVDILNTNPTLKNDLCTALGGCV